MERSRLAIAAGAFLAVLCTGIPAVLARRPVALGDWLPPRRDSCWIVPGGMHIGPGPEGAKLVTPRNESRPFRAQMFFRERVPRALPWAGEFLPLWGASRLNLPAWRLAYPLLAENWHDLSPKQRYDALQNYWQHEQLPQDRQRDIEQRYERWRSMPPDQRARIRQNYERYRQLPPRERERFQQKYEKWRHQGGPPQ
jgi:hypothetical protein